jgi:hypothetical protein
MRTAVIAFELHTEGAKPPRTATRQALEPNQNTTPMKRINWLLSRSVTSGQLFVGDAALLGDVRFGHSNPLSSRLSASASHRASFFRALWTRAQTVLMGTP